LPGRPAGRLLASAAAVAAAVLVPSPPPDAEVLRSQPVIITRPVAAPAVTAVVPRHLVIPKIGVSADVVPVGTDETGAMQTPATARDVAWWSGTRPGAGNALFAGHRDWKGRQGSFFRLTELAPGDEITVTDEEATLRFRVVWVRQINGEPPAEMLGDAPSPVVTLITCGGAFDRSIRHYTDRVVARAVLVA
jgi:LPXTG-site transpeptidase (sortase) family protein